MITRDQVRFELDIELEHLRIDGNASESGDAAFDKQVCDEIRERLARGDFWAWCSVRVQGVFECTYQVHGGMRRERLVFDEHLGAVSCADEADFKASGDYDAMCDAIVDRFNAIGQAIVDGKVKP